MPPYICQLIFGCFKGTTKTASSTDGLNYFYKKLAEVTLHIISYNMSGNPVKSDLAIPDRLAGINRETDRHTNILKIDILM